jgi:hypothetical protein
MESVNMGEEGNHVTLHTTKGCKIGPKRRRRQTGKAETYDCYNATNGNVGCGVLGPPSSYGSAFNAGGGGIYALEIRDEGIRAWLFPRSAIPNDIFFGKPDPSTWPTPLADFPNLECDIKRHFKNLRIVVNIALCGDWAGQQSVFGSDRRCEGSCENWVAWRPDMFQEAYWEFGGFWVYGKDVEQKKGLGSGVASV